MRALVKRNEAFPRGSELNIAMFGQEGSNVQRSAQRIANMFSYVFNCVKLSIVDVSGNPTIQRRKVDSKDGLQGQSCVSAFSGRGMLELLGRPRDRG